MAWRERLNRLDDRVLGDAATEPKPAVPLRWILAGSCAVAGLAVGVGVATGHTARGVQTGLVTVALLARGLVRGRRSRPRRRRDG